MYTRSSLGVNCRQILRFGSVGVLNTVLGYGIILMSLWLGLGAFASNALGYLAGLLLGFTLNRRWTFRYFGHSNLKSMVRYVLAFLVAYGINFIVLLFASWTGLTLQPLIQLAAISAYSVVFYLELMLFVFPKRGAPVSDHAHQCHLQSITIGGGYTGRQRGD